jgi:fructose-bisphosphate aldolase class II
MHQDHGTSPKVCQGAIDLGFGSVMMDGSLMEDGKTPRQLRLQRRRHPQGGRHGARGRRHGRRRTGLPGLLETGDAGEEDGIGAEGKLDHSQMLTDPEKAADFVKATSSTRWPSPSAPATAPTSSAASPPATSWPSPRQGNPRPHPQHPPGDARLVSVPQDLLAIINQYGGKMKETYGVPVEEIQEGPSSTACARSTSTPTSAWP